MNFPVARHAWAPVDDAGPISFPWRLTTSGSALPTLYSSFQISDILGLQALGDQDSIHSKPDGSGDVQSIPMFGRLSIVESFQAVAGF